MQEHFMDQIIDSKPVSKGFKCLVRGERYGPEDEWIVGHNLEDKQTMDSW